MTTKEAHVSAVNTPRKDSYRVYHSGLMAQLEGDPGRLFLLSAIKNFSWSDTPRDTGDDPYIDHNFWERHWHMRERARRVISGVERWPPEFLPWKAMQELRYYHGRAKRPLWLDANVSPLADYAPRIKRPSLRSLRFNAKRARR